jgi:hypothetical protein
VVAALLLAASLVAGTACGSLELVRAQDLTTLREGYPELPLLDWYGFAYDGDTLCWRRGDTIAMGDSLARFVLVAFADDGHLYRLGLYDLRVSARKFYSLPRAGRLQVKMIAGFPLGSRPGALRVVPVVHPPPAKDTRP